MKFDLETLDDLRTEHVKNTLEAMSAVLKDSKAKINDKIEAGKVIAMINDTLVRAKIIDSEAANSKGMERTANKLVQQLEKLSDQED